MQLCANTFLSYQVGTRKNVAKFSACLTKGGDVGLMSLDMTSEWGPASAGSAGSTYSARLFQGKCEVNTILKVEVSEW